MAVSKQLFVLIQILMINSLINTEVLAVIPNINQLRQLIRGILIPNFQQGGLVLPGRQQFAVALLLPHANTQWTPFLFHPSQNGNGQTPVINPNNPLSPPNQLAYNNYLAARPYMGVHSEIQILNRLGGLYNAYRLINNQPPRALLLYSWIVPCITCTDEIVRVFTSAPFNTIPTRVVAYTTNGGCSHSDCDVNYTENRLRNNSIDVTKVRTKEEELIKTILEQLMDE